MVKKKSVTPVNKTPKAPAVPKAPRGTYMDEIRKQAEKMHQQNIRMIETSNMSKAEKVAALKRLRDAYGM